MQDQELEQLEDLGQMDGVKVGQTFDAPVVQGKKSGRPRFLSAAFKISALLSLLILAGVVLAQWIWSAPESQSPLFLSLQHQRPGQLAYSTWQDKLHLQGSAEQVLVQDFARAGVQTVEQLIPKNQRRLLSDGHLSPSPVAILAATSAWIGMLGKLHCVQVGGAAEQGNKQVRAELQIKAIKLEEQRVLFSHASEGLADDDDIEKACQKAEAKAAKKIAPALLDQLQAYLPLPEQKTNASTAQNPK